MEQIGKFFTQNTQKAALNLTQAINNVWSLIHPRGVFLVAFINTPDRRLSHHLPSKEWLAKFTHPSSRYPLFIYFGQKLKCHNKTAKKIRRSQKLAVCVTLNYHYHCFSLAEVSSSTSQNIWHNLYAFLVFVFCIFMQFSFIFCV